MATRTILESPVIKTKDINGIIKFLESEPGKAIKGAKKIRKNYKAKIDLSIK